MQGDGRLLTRPGYCFQCWLRGRAGGQNALQNKGTWSGGQALHPATEAWGAGSSPTTHAYAYQAANTKQSWVFERIKLQNTWGGCSAGRLAWVCARWAAGPEQHLTKRGSCGQAGAGDQRNGCLTRTAFGATNLQPTNESSLSPHASRPHPRSCLRRRVLKNPGLHCFISSCNLPGPQESNAPCILPLFV